MRRTQRHFTKSRRWTNLFVGIASPFVGLPFSPVSLETTNRSLSTKRSSSSMKHARRPDRRCGLYFLYPITILLLTSVLGVLAQAQNPARQYVSWSSINNGGDLGNG